MNSSCRDDACGAFPASHRMRRLRALWTGTLRRTAGLVLLVAAGLPVRAVEPALVTLVDAGRPATWDAGVEPLRIEGPFDLSPQRSIRLDIESHSLSLEDIEIAFLSPDPANSYFITLRADWTGVQPLHFEKNWFSTRGRPAGWTNIAAMEIRLARPLSSGTRMTLRRAVAHPEQALVKYGDHEVLIDPFRRIHWRRMDQWRIAVPEAPAPDRAGMPTGYYDNHFWYQPDPDRRDTVVFERVFDVDIARYGELRIELSAGRNTHVTLGAQVDGVWVAGPRYVKGEGRFCQLVMSLEGKRLEGFRLDLSEPENMGERGRVACQLNWIMLREKGVPDYQPRLRTAPALDRTRTPVRSFEQRGLPVGLYFTREDVPRLRERAHSAWGREVWAGLRQRADAALELDPEDWVADNIYYSFGVQATGVNSRFLETLMDPALAYVITGDLRYADLARRALLCLCHVQSWSNPEYAYPYGARFQTFNISAMQHTTAAVLAYDCIANTLTPDEDALVRQRVFEEGYAALVNHVVDWGDWTNRGASMAGASLIALRLLGMDVPGAERVRRRATEKLLDIAEQYFGRAGVTREGLGYGGVTVYGLVKGLPLAAELNRIPVPALVGGTALHRFYDVYTWMRSNAAHQWTNLNYSMDKFVPARQRPASPLFFTHYFGDRQAQWIYRNVERAYSPRDIPREMFELAWHDPDLTAEAPQLGYSRHFVGDGFTFWRTGWQYGDVLFALQSGPPMRGHRDRNAFVLEAYGERLALDAGQFGGYDDPDMAQVFATERHNCPTFDRKDQEYRRGVPAAEITKFLTGDTLEFQAADATGSYSGAARVQRRVAFLRPDLFLLVDDLAGKEQPAVLATHINSAGVPEIDGNRFVLRGEQGLLEGWILAPPQVVIETARFSTDHREVTAHQLTIRTPEPVIETAFVLLLHPVQPDREGQLRVTPVPWAGGAAAAIDDEGQRAVVLAGPGQGVVGGVAADTDAALAVARWQQGRLTATGMLNGTRLAMAETDVRIDADARVTLNVEFLHAGGAVARIIGAAGTKLRFPLPGTDPTCLDAAGRWHTLAGTDHDGLHEVILPPAVTEYDETILAAGLSEEQRSALSARLELRQHAGLSSPDAPTADVAPMRDAVASDAPTGLGEILAVGFTPDGKSIALGSDLGLAWIFDAETCALRHTLRGHRDGLLALACHPGGQLLATASWDRTVRLWNVQTGETVRELSGHTLPVGGVAFSPDGVLIASGGWDKTVRLWETDTGHQRAVLSGHTGRVHAVTFCPTGHWLASGGSDYAVRLWDVATGELVRTLWPDLGPVLSVDLAPDGKSLIAGGWSFHARRMDIETGAVLADFPDQSGYNFAAFSPDGRQVATGTRKNPILQLWHADGERIERRFSGAATVLNIDTSGQAVRVLESHTKAIRALAFSPDRTRILTGSRDHTARLWDAQTGRALHVFAEKP